MLNKEEIEKAKEELKKEIENSSYIRDLAKISDSAKEIMLRDNAIETLLQYIDQLEQKNKALKGVLSNELYRDEKTCFYEDGNTGKCLGYSNVNDDEPCEYCKSCEALSIKGDD